jgi:hypothetical protein
VIDEHVERYARVARVAAPSRIEARRIARHEHAIFLDERAVGLKVHAFGVDPDLLELQQLEDAGRRRRVLILSGLDWPAMSACAIAESAGAEAGSTSGLLEQALSAANTRPARTRRRKRSVIMRTMIPLSQPASHAPRQIMMNCGNPNPLRALKL